MGAFRQMKMVKQVALISITKRGIINPLKIIQNGPNGQNDKTNLVKNGGPDLKRARRIGLSARGARRTKGLKLEVF